MTEQEKMLSGELYLAADAELVNAHRKALALTRRYNATTEDQEGERAALIQELFGEIGEEFHIEPPFRCDYGTQIEVGRRFFMNYDCVFLDVCPIRIGDDVLIGPRVSLLTAAHPTDAKIRNTGLEYGKPITIGSSVWIGGGVIINPGVTIGDNVVIGSGSVVTRDIPSGVIAAGNPCRVLRALNENDRQLWQGQASKHSKVGR